MKTEKILFKEKMGYGCGDFASSLFWKIFSMYLMIYYTDVVELSPASVGTMLLLTRLWDGINDPIMGIVADRTNTSQGKFRPYLKWVAIPFAVVAVLTFSVPDFGPAGKLIYAYITYTLMMMVYTAINVPYSSLMGVMTPEPKERTSLASFRFIGAYGGGLFMTATFPYLLNYFKSSSTIAESYQYTVVIYGLVAALFFYLTFLGTKERVKPKVEKPEIKRDLADLKKNAQWFIMLGTGVSVLIYNCMRDGAIIYYFKYVVIEQDVPGFGLVGYEKLAGAYMTVWLAANMIGVLFAKGISEKFGKKQTFMAAMFVSGAFSLTMLFIEPHQLGLIFFTNLMMGLSVGLVLPLMWAMYADIADYSEYQTGRRATGLIFSSSSMSQKMGGTLAGAIAGWILAAYGFEANAAQSATSLQGIKLMISLYPAIGAGLSILFLSFYKLDDNFMTDISAKLQSRLNKKEKMVEEPVIN